MKKSFILYTEWKNVFKSLHPEDAGELINALFSYQADEEIELPPPLLAVFVMMRQAMDRDAEAYEKRLEVNKANGSLGGRPKTQRNPEEPKETQNNPTLTQPNPKKHDNDNVNDSDNEKEENNNINIITKEEKSVSSHEELERFIFNGETEKEKEDREWWEKTASELGYSVEETKRRFHQK